MDPTTNATTSRPPATELVWDSGSSATALSGSSLLAEGPGTAWSPALLLATAAGASLLTTFIELAQSASVPVLGYVAQQRAETDANTNEVAEVTVSACVTVPSCSAADAARALWTTATKQAPVLKALACRVRCEPSIVVLSNCDCPPTPE